MEAIIGTVQLPQQWEYKTLVLGETDFARADKLAITLTEAGAQGWELMGWQEFRLASYHKYTAIFKRPVTGPTGQPPGYERGP